MDKATREMSFEEEAKLYEEEARAEFAKESGYGDIEGVNTILRRGMRIVRKAREEIAHGVTVQEWISVKDRLPDVGSIVLVSDNETDCHIWQYTNYSERGVAMPWMDEFGIPCKTEEITHWMPLPQPPKGE